MGLPDHLAGLLTPSVELIETNIAWLLLTGERVYKIKRPVKLPFLDMRSAERRRFLCAEEVRLNRRFAPELYLDVVPITSTAEGVRIGGSGEVIEHAVCMRRFAAADQLDRLLNRHAVTLEEMATFGRGLARIHEGLPRIDAAESFGRASAVREVMLENVRQCAQLSKRQGTEEEVRALEPLIIRALDSTAALMNDRRANGSVRECHGDLHTRNVARHGDKLIAFDCLEFEPAFRWIDVAEEIAFLYMDVLAEGHIAHATAFLNGWLAESGDFGACRLVRLYAAHRALVRAKVAAMQPDAELNSSYIRTARALLDDSRPRLVLMRGLSGSGKSWLAARLAPVLGAVLIRSDVERKRMAGLHESASSASGLQSGLYSPEATANLYARLAECARDVLEGGLSAIVDATFLMRKDRASLATVAAECGIPVTLIDCQAPVAVLESRIQRRAQAGKDASEADLSVLRWQQTHAEPIDDRERLQIIEADTTRDSLAEELLAALRPNR